MKHYPHLLALEKNYSAVLLDAFGVFWAGNATGPIEAAKETMRALVAHGRVVGILSNSTQPSMKEIAKFEKHGMFEGEHFHFVVTSGDVARSLFLTEKLPFTTAKKRYFLFGGAHPKYSAHTALFHETGFQEVADIQEAEFLYVNVPHINGEDQIDPTLFEASVKEILHHNLPMVCANPDRFAHEGAPPKAVVRQGTIATIYEKLGGNVFYIGKPEKEAFEMAFTEFRARGIHDLNDIVMVGDTPETDIRGANRSGIASVLLTETGMMHERIRQFGLDKAVAMLPQTDHPEYFVGRL